MASFREILCSSGEELLKIFYVFNKDDFSEDNDKKLVKIAGKFKLKPQQLVCAIGFNPNLTEMTEIIPVLGFDNADGLIQERNEIFINDVYKNVSLDNILTIYEITRNHPEVLQVMQYLIDERLKFIETRIEETVNSMLIEKYKLEIKSIYMDGIAGLDFAEMRLSQIDSGFRALVNEVTIITESKLIPIGDIFFRDSILPEEKRKLLNKGLIPLELVHTRLEDNTIPQRERKMLLDYLVITKQNDTGTT